MTTLDTVIVGGGPAGLSAALILGRARRHVMLCDAGTPRNAASHAMHGYLSRDGMHPGEFLRVSREQLACYPTVTVRRMQVMDAQQTGDSFAVTLDNGERLSARTLLLATGVVDEVPVVPGLDDLYGRSVHHCPYCDGWEHRDAPIAVYGRGQRGLGLALELTQWSRDLVLCTDGPNHLSAEQRRRLVRQRIALRSDRIARLEGRDGQLERIIFVAGDALARRALFFSTGQRQHSDLPARLGCSFTTKGAVRRGRMQDTSVRGLYIAGDADRDVQLVVVAAAEGARAAFAINTALLKEDLHARDAADTTAG